MSRGRRGEKGANTVCTANDDRKLAGGECGLERAECSWKGVGWAGREGSGMVYDISSERELAGKVQGLDRSAAH